MYNTCPKCQYQRTEQDSTDPDTCPACGIIYSKWLKQQVSSQTPVIDYEEVSDDRNIWKRVISSVLYVNPKTDTILFYPKLILFGLFFIWGWYFILLDLHNNPFAIGQSYMHNIDLIFHEAGHVLFRPFGWFMTILGGSLFQVMMPLIVMFYFIFKNHDNYSASFGLWWAGQSCMDVAPYIDDALDQKLVLLGGRTGADMPGNHDWNNILGDLNRLEKCHEYASFVDYLGTGMMLLAFIWGGYILFREYQVSH